jgi:hypothetical protein
LPHSDALFIQAFERECTETFWEGHVRGFGFLGGVPRRITYDNSRVMVARIVGPRQRQLTKGFLQLKSHYLFDHHFCHRVVPLGLIIFGRPYQSHSEMQGHGDGQQGALGSPRRLDCGRRHLHA